MSGLPDLPPHAFDKEDASPDGDFYAPARLVTHLDAAAIGALTAFYAGILPPDGVILDLMSSWVSHLPDGLPTRAVIGQGMNAEELAANPRLDHRFVQDLNRTPDLPLEAASCDAALCCCGVQYLQRPLEVFAQVRRVLKPGAPVVVSFSNRCFATKAVAIWRALGEPGHARLVALYLERAGFAGARIHRLAQGNGDPLTAVTAVAVRNDPDGRRDPAPGRGPGVEDQRA